MKNSEVENEINDKKISELDIVELTEWLIFKIKIIYGRPIFEGNNSDEASAIRQEWHDLVRKIGKKGILATIDYLLSGHHAVPSFPPSSVEFTKCYRIHVSPFIVNTAPEGQHRELPTSNKQGRQEGYQQFKEFVKTFKAMHATKIRECSIKGENQ